MAERLDEQTMALRVAREFHEGMIVNLGAGIPTLAINYIPEGEEVLFHTENGCLGFGRGATTDEERDFHLINASGQPADSESTRSIGDGWPSPQATNILPP